jgi:hypothetical protein
MEDRHQRTLMSIYATLQQLVEEVRAISGRGVSPSHSAGLMTPLPPPERARVESGLDAILADARGIVAEHAPSLLAEHERPRAVAHTRSWIDALLGRVESLVDDMDPRRLSQKYGALTPEEIADLEPRLRAIREHLRRLRGERR